MDQDQKDKPPRMSGEQIAQLIFGIVLFGVLMGLRTEFQSLWLRMLVAGCAGAVLAIFVLPLRRRKN